MAEATLATGRLVGHETAMNETEKHEAFYFLVGSCQTQTEVDDLWMQCYGYPNPQSP